MEIRQLRYFLAVADARSFLKAADLLYVSRQAVSKAVTQLEEELGVELFVRSQNGAMMSPAGIYFYPRAVTIVADFDKLYKEMREIDRTYRPKINICMALGVHDIYAYKLTRYGEQHRHEMDIRVSCCLDSECGAVLTDRRADMVLSSLPINSALADTTVVLESPVCLLVNRNHPLADRDSLSPEEMDNATMLCYTGGHDHCLWLTRDPLMRCIHSNDLSYLFSLLKEGVGMLPIAVAAIPEYLDFITIKPYPFRSAPYKIHCSMLGPSYYNLFMYNMLGEVLHDVFLEH